MESSSKPAGRVCGAERGGGLRCKMPGTLYGGRCKWHYTPATPEPEPIMTVGKHDRALLSPLLSRLVRWAREYDAVGEGADEPLTRATDFLDWLRLELTFPRPWFVDSGHDRA